MIYNCDDKHVQVKLSSIFTPKNGYTYQDLLKNEIPKFI